MAMPASKSYTAEMGRALPEDGNRYETVYGELLVTPAPRALHQLAHPGAAGPVRGVTG